MLGYNSHEGIVMIPDVIRNNKYELYDKDLIRFIPKSIDLDVKDPRCQHVGNAIRDLYFNGQNLTNRNIGQLVHLMSDYHFVLSMHLTAELYALHQHR